MSENIVESCEGSISVYGDRMKTIEKWVKTIDYEDDKLYFANFGSFFGIYGYSSDVTHSVFMSIMRSDMSNKIEFEISKNDFLKAIAVKDYLYTLSFNKNGIYIEGNKIGNPTVIDSRPKTVYNVISKEIENLKKSFYKAYICRDVLMNTIKYFDKVGISTMYIELEDSEKLHFKGDLYDLDVNITYKPYNAEFKEPKTFMVDPKYLLNIVSTDDPEIVVTENLHLINFLCNKKTDLFTLATKLLSD